MRACQQELSFVGIMQKKVFIVIVLPLTHGTVDITFSLSQSLHGTSELSEVLFQEKILNEIIFSAHLSNPLLTAKSVLHVGCFHEQNQVSTTS